jgi:nucleoside-diphosphate-sugar epimerase
MRVLLLGGTGAIGSHLAEILSKSGKEVHITSRKEHVDSDNVTYHQIDAQDLKSLTSLLNEFWDVIVDFMIYSTDKFRNRVVSLLNATNQYIFISSSRVYADTDGLLIENSARLNEFIDDKLFLSTDEYSLTKARQEDILKNSLKKNWTIVRPYITYSEKRLQLGVLEKEEWLYRALKGRTIVFSEDIVNKITTLTYGYDVSSAIAQLLGKTATIGNSFHITVSSRYSMKWSEVLDVYCNILLKHLGYKPKVLLLGLKKFLIFREKSKYQVIYDRLYNRRFDTSKVEKLVDVDRFVDPSKGLEHCLTKFIENPRFKEINWKMEGIRDKYAKEWTPLNEISGLKCKLKYLFYRCC